MAEGQRQGAENRQPTPEAVEDDDIDIQLEQPDTGDDLDISLEPNIQEQPSSAGTQEADDDIFIEEPEIELDATGAAEADQEDEDSQTATTTPVQQTTPPTGAPAAPPVTPPPPPSEPPEQPIEAPEEDETEEVSVEEERDERRENLQELIDDFAEISEDELQNYNEFRQLSNRKIKNCLKSFARRAVVYAAVGVGVGLLTQAAPVAIAVGIAGGLGGSTLGRGLVDAVKRFSGAEKKEQETRGQISEIQTDKIGNLIALARRVKSLEDLPGQQGQNPETSEITTIEQAKRDFLEALIDFNDMESQNNRQIAGLRKKLSRSQRGWGIAKTVAGIAGGITGGIAASAELKAALVDKVAEEGMQMTGDGLGEAAPNLAPGHLVHIHEGQVVFDYNPGDLAEIYSNIANNPELAQSFVTDQATAELVNQGMHQAGEQMSQEFIQKVGQVATERTAAYVVGAVATAEATDAVLRATSRNRSGEWISGSSNILRSEADGYRGDLQAEAGARQNERFRSMFVDQNGQIPEGVPSIDEDITLDQTISLSGPEGDIIINPGEHLQIMGVDQNGNILATHTESGQILAFQRDDFYRNIIEPRISNNEETDEMQDEAEEDEKNPPIKEKNPLEKERNELIGTIQTVEIDKKIDDQKFVCVINGKSRRITVSEPSTESIETGFQAKIKILEVWGDDNEFVRADVERVFKEAEFEGKASADTDSKQRALPPAEEKDQKSLPPAPELKALPPAEFEKEEKMRELVREALSPGAVWVLSSGEKSNMVADRVSEPTDKVEQIQIDEEDKFILDNITKQYRRDVVIFHRIDQVDVRDVMQADPNAFLRKLTPASIKEIDDNKERAKARELLINEYNKMIERIPGRDPKPLNVGDDTSMSEVPVEEAKDTMQQMAESEGGKEGQKLEKIKNIDQLRKGDKIVVSNDASSNVEVSSSGGEEQKSLIRDFDSGTEFTFNGPAPEEEGGGLLEIEVGGVKYYLYDNEVVENFMAKTEPVVTDVEEVPEGIQKSLPPAREEVSPLGKIAEIARKQKEAAAKASANYKIQPYQGPKISEGEGLLNSYDFEYGLDKNGDQKRIEIVPGQSWRLIAGDGSIHDVGIESITPGQEAGMITIKLRNVEPKTYSVEKWKEIFDGAESLQERSRNDDRV